MQKIFISYSRKDIAFTKKLAGDLEKAGYDVWWDITDLRGGEDWVKKIPAAIEEAQHFIVVLTPNSVKSEWVQKEYTQALTLQKKILPIMLRSCPVPFALNTINFVNFMVGEYPESFKDLLSALGYEGKPPVVTPYEQARIILPPPLRKYTLPILIGIAALFAVVLFTMFKPTEPVVVTPTIDSVNTSTATLTASPAVTVEDAPSATITVTVTVASTLTPTPSLTPTVTNQPFDMLTYCSNSWQSSTINVRTGPGTGYAVLGEPLPLRQCLTFHAVNEGQTWLLIAPGQEDPRHVQYEGGWIFRELLGLGLVGPIDLPVVTLTFTPTPSNTLTPSHTPTITPSPTLTPSETPSPTETAAESPTLTPTP